MPNARTLGELRRSDHQPKSVRDELRAAVAARISRGEPVLPGMVGYEETVVPEVENALLSGHHMVLLGERGQGKSRLLRGLVALLDEWVPAVEGCDIHCDPLAPVCRSCQNRVAKEGDDLPVAWVHREDRYGEKLATPDVSVADLIGEVDPIKIAEGRYLADEEAIHFGLVPRSHRGIFAINELPDLMEKIQVALFNLMEERDVQIKGFRVRLPLDLLIVASANPEDYTSRGRIITPLKDRFDAQIRTHYPTEVSAELAIVDQEVPIAERGGRPVRVPDFMKGIIGRMTFEARDSHDINQASGVSVRATINNYETLVANAERRSLRLGENEIVPRVSDLEALGASMLGKLEFEYTGEENTQTRPLERLINRAILHVFDETLQVEALADLEKYFQEGGGVEVSDTMPSEEYLEGIRAIPGLRAALDEMGPFESPALMASATEFILEGLHLHQRLNKDLEGGRITYQA